ncbi:uncharacterized protein HD556DRAFT_349922 [Suillus plorans]|uniref:Uncharacterized protein n=1 Tax=Suillus plorans TaxID=116603 RepID=A0A9P7J7N8_9AGAM|nr:uncharacterized protein HD556DRAFT_349922 [Suillus plorans]KAG1806885.1 hypothetical protein HD556DRAFT_349922 [Suillus plorans]
MNQYAFPSSHSPYSTHQTVAYPTSPHSQHGHGSYNYGTPLRRASTGHTYASSPQYGYPPVVQAPQTTQYLSVPNSHHRSRSQSRHSHSRPRANSHSHHRSHSTSHRHRSHSRPAHSYAGGGDYHRGRSVSIGDRFRNFLGMEPSSNSYYNSYGNQGHGHHNSQAYGGMRDERRPRKHSGYVDEHGREVDSRGRMIHRY